MAQIQYWDFIEKYAKKYDTLSDKDKKFAIRHLLSDTTTADYCYVYMVEAIIDKLDKKDAIAVLKRYIGSESKSGYGYYRRHRSPKLLLKTAKLMGNDAKKVFLSSKSKDANVRKAVLFLPSVTLDEEVSGLRAVSESKFVMEELYEAKYKPSLDALKKLPPIMRLKTIESLFSGTLTYNIVEKIPYDDFKDLFFASTMKYRDRVEALCDKYREASECGTPARIKITAECKYCGSYSIALDSCRARTESGLKKTRLSYLIDGNRCALCGKHESLIQNATVTGDSDE